MNTSHAARNVADPPLLRSRSFPDHHSLRLMLALIIVVTIGLGARVVYIQVVSRQQFLAAEKWLSSPRQPLWGQSGAIRDRSGHIVADSVVVASVKADPRLVCLNHNVGQVSKKLSAILGMPAEQIAAQLNSDRRFVYLSRRAPLDVAQRVMALRLSGVSQDLEYKRVYPQVRIGCHLLGYHSSDHRPLGGLEYQYRFLITGQPGTPRRNQDQWGRTIVGMEDQPVLPPVPGKDLVLTVDWDTQRVVEEALDRCWQRESPDQATTVVMDPNTGAILAMASRPSYDPNRIASAGAGVARVDIPQANLLNLPVSREYEPGSTFKVLLAAAAVETGALKPSETFVCPGRIQMGGKPLSCWGRWAHQGHGRLDLASTIVKSCNICAARIALKIGAKKYWEFLRRCGIGSPTWIGLPGETDGKLRTPSQMEIRDLANMGFGQGVAVTDVQLLAAICAVVNGGRLMQPYLVDRVLNTDGTTYRQVEPLFIREVCTPATSRTIRKLLRGVVESPGGTGYRARIPGVAVGGKTGTAQMWDPERQRYRPYQHMLSFVLVAPVDIQPEFAILVTVKNPKRGEHGGQVAGPVAREIAVYMLQERDLIPPEALPKLNGS